MKMLCTEIQHNEVSRFFLLEIMQVRRQWINIIKATERKKKLSIQDLYPLKISFTIKGKINNFLDIQDLKECIDSRTAI